MSHDEAWSEIQRRCPGVRGERVSGAAYGLPGTVWAMTGPRGMHGVLDSLAGAGPESVREWARILSLTAP